MRLLRNFRRLLRLGDRAKRKEHGAKRAATDLAAHVFVVAL